MIMKLTILQGETSVVLEGKFRSGHRNGVPFFEGFANNPDRTQALLDITNATISTDTGQTLHNAWQAGSLTMDQLLKVRFEGTQLTR